MLRVLGVHGRRSRQQGDYVRRLRCEQHE
jgi:hypothetical protein